MQYPQAMHLTADAHLLHSFLRDFSRSLSAHPIQPLLPESLEATPLVRVAQSWENGAVLEGAFPTKVAL